MTTTDDLTLRQLEQRCRAHGTVAGFKRYGTHVIIIREVVSNDAEAGRSA